MIFVARSPVPPRLDLNNKESAASKELAEGIEHFHLTNRPPEVKRFKAYSHEEVREALTALFHGKCAYCESEISGSSQTDIEHYRPKGGVSDADDADVYHPGYWWLAMRWDNLVLSCMHCNQDRRQLIFNEDMTEEEIHATIIENGRQTTGKKNAFPTEDDVWVTTHDGDVDQEKPLLIDPTITDPAPHFEWVTIGKITTMKAKDSLRGRTTIRILGLNRRYLTESRWKKYDTLNALGEDLHMTLLEIRDAETDEGAELAKRAATRLLRNIAKLGEADQSHAALARTYLDKITGVVADMI